MAKKLSLKELLTDEAAAERIRELSFEEGLALMEDLVGQVESGNLALDKAMSSYEKGVALVDHLRSLLSGAEEKLVTLKKSSQSN